MDGDEIKDLKVKSLRSSISLVTQTIILFPGTVMQNIAYGKEDATEEEIISSAKIAEAHDFIMNLPNSYDTQIGEGGHKLSGGQRQRLSIARAVLKDAPILILDEATSSVDNETEEALQKSLETISKDRTTIVIAHRLSTIRHSDSIIVLESGKVVESGTHEELLDNKLQYYKLWNVQNRSSLIPDSRPYDPLPLIPIIGPVDQPGRSPALQAGGLRFKSRRVHHF